MATSDRNTKQRGGDLGHIGFLKGAIVPLTSRLDRLEVQDFEVPVLKARGDGNMTVRGVLGLSTLQGTSIQAVHTDSSVVAKAEELLKARKGVVTLMDAQAELGDNSLADKIADRGKEISTLEAGLGELGEHFQARVFRPAKRSKSFGAESFVVFLDECRLPRNMTPKMRIRASEVPFPGKGSVDVLYSPDKRQSGPDRSPIHVDIDNARRRVVFLSIAGEIQEKPVTGTTMRVMVERGRNHDKPFTFCIVQVEATVSGQLHVMQCDPEGVATTELCDERPKAKKAAPPKTVPEVADKNVASDGTGLNTGAFAGLAAMKDGLPADSDADRTPASKAGEPTVDAVAHTEEVATPKTDTTGAAEEGGAKKS